VEPECPDGKNGWYITKPSIRISTNETATVYYRIDSGEQQVYESSLDLPDGVHDLYYYSMDLAGNIEAEKSLQVKVDSCAPEISAGITPFRSDNFYLAGEPISFFYNATDTASGVELLFASVNGTPVISGDSLGFGKVGEYGLSIRTLDFAGNEATKTAAFTVGYDFKWLPPVKRKGGSANDAYRVRYNATVPIRFAALDGFGKFVADKSVKVVLADGTNFATLNYGKGSRAVKINACDKKYRLNLKLKDYPWIKPGGSYKVSVYFGGNNQYLGLLHGEVLLITK